jgi:hypothetical protein
MGGRKMISTKNFNPISDHKLLCTCGHIDCDHRSVSQEHLDRIQKVREALNHPLTVTSGGRCPFHADEKRRTKPADHQNRVGIDLACSGSTRGNIVQAGIEAGCNAIGVAKTFVHLGYRENLPKGHLTMWVY